MADASYGTPSPKRPYMVGPELYEVHTDANLFVTHVFVNGHKLKLSNAEGNGSVRTEFYGVSGPTGYPNKAFLNAYLRPGDNEVKVVFDSPLLEEVRGTEAEKAFIQDMYAHVVINTGQLTKGSLGTKSYYLDQLIAAPDRTAEIIKNALLRRFTEDQLSREVSVTQTITVGPKNAVQVKPEDCDLDLSGFSNFRGMVLLNGAPVYEVDHFGSAQTLDRMKNLLKRGENIFEVKVTEVREGETALVKLLLECDVSRAIKESNLAEDHQSIQFGSFFNKVRYPLVKIDIQKPGTYSSSFSGDF